MECDWGSFLGILPAGLRERVDETGRLDLRELRLREGQAPWLVFDERTWALPGKVAQKELQYCLNAATAYSPWASDSLSSGYLTLQGGHRMGVCGETILKAGKITGYGSLSSVCIRLARDIPCKLGTDSKNWGSTLILGPPGWGKTTLLRCLSRALSRQNQVAVVDERQELFPPGFSRGPGLDVLSGCPKALGIPMVLRTMGPEYIALDEITAKEDTQAITLAVGCGVKLLAKAHALSREDLLRRPVYRGLVDLGAFETLLILHKDKSFHLERMEP